MNSLKMRLAVGALLGALVVTGGCGSLLYYLIRTDLYHHFDESLVARAKSLGALSEFDEEGYNFEALGEVGEAGLPKYFVIRHGGKVLVASKALRKAQFDWPDTDEKSQSVKRFELRNEKMRAAVVLIDPRIDPDARAKPAPLEVLVAEPTEDLEEELARLALLICFAALAGVALSFGAIWLIVPRALQPLSRVAGKIRALDVAALKPLDAGPVPKELEPVVAQLDALVARMNETLRREQDFSAGAAHELRTPLAGMRAKLELALSKPRAPEEHKALAQSALEIAERMQALIANLMLFARANQAQGSPSAAPIDLNALLHDAWQPFEERAKARGLSVNWKLEGEAAISTRADLLNIIVANLFDNAVSYVNESGSIEISGSGRAISVSNTGCKLAAGDAEKVFEPFWRGDESRTGEMHAGLGLAICKRMATALGAQLSVNIADGRFTAALTFA